MRFAFATWDCSSVEISGTEVMWHKLATGFAGSGYLTDAKKRRQQLHPHPLGQRLVGRLRGGFYLPSSGVKKMIAAPVPAKKLAEKRLQNPKAKNASFTRCLIGFFWKYLHPSNTHSRSRNVANSCHKTFGQVHLVWRITVPKHSRLKCLEPVLMSFEKLTP